MFYLDSPCMNDEKTITLQPATEADESFLLTVYASTREDEMAQVPWTADQKEAFARMQFTAQKQHYAAQYPQAHHDVIYVKGIPVGRLYLDRTGERFHILDITILPQHRNAGTGAAVLRRIMAEAGRAGKALTIYIESFNPSLRLFSRLGFQRTEENGFHLLLKYS